MYRVHHSSWCQGLAIVGCTSPLYIDLGPHRFRWYHLGCINSGGGGGLPRAAAAAAGSEEDISHYLSLDGCWFHCLGCKVVREAMRSAAAESRRRTSERASKRRGSSAVSASSGGETIVKTVPEAVGGGDSSVLKDGKADKVLAAEAAEAEGRKDGKIRWQLHRAGAQATVPVDHSDIIILDIGEIRRARDDGWDGDCESHDGQSGSMAGAFGWRWGGRAKMRLSGREGGAAVADWGLQRRLLTGPSAQRDLSAVARCGWCGWCGCYAGIHLIIAFSEKCPLLGLLPCASAVPRFQDLLKAFLSQGA